MSTANVFGRVCVVGLGLIGASLLSAIKKNQLATTLIGVDTHQKSVQAAIECRLIDEGYDTIDKVRADCVILAVPVKQMKDIFVAIAQNPHLTDSIVSDVGSTKAEITRQAYQIFGEGVSRFVPAHPIAGAENSGFFAKNAHLFCQHKVIICTHPKIDIYAMSKITTLWQQVGAKVVQMDSDRHDKVLSYTSHLPHLLAYALTHHLASHDDNLDIFRYAAGGFRDFSRIAASNSQMWHDIFLANKKAVLSSLYEYIDELNRFALAIENEHSDVLLAMLDKSCDARRHFGHMLNTKKDTVMTNERYILKPASQLSGIIKVAPDKSISHRSIMLGSLADGVTRVSNFLEGEDALSTLQAFCDMGVKIDRQGDTVTIYGVGIDGLVAPDRPLDMGNSGTSMRLLLGILSAQSFNSVMIGDISLSARPMERVAMPLRQMGADIQTTGKNGTAPLSVQGKSLSAIDYTLPVASAQIKSCLLLAGIFADGKTIVREPKISRDHTERMLLAFGYDIYKDKDVISLTGGKRLTACDITIPNDISSAAFFMVGACISRGSNITLTGVGVNPTRTGVIDILKMMGANITLINERLVGGEPVADIVVKSAKLHGIDIPPHLVPLAIDEFPEIFIAASCAKGETTLTGAKELRVKESDRIAVMADGLATLGIESTVLDDGIVIVGKGGDGYSPIFGGGQIDCHHDHRIAMSFAMASLRALDTIVITGTQTVNTSFPTFAQLASEAGLSLLVESE